MKPERLNKRDALQHWAGLDPADPAPHMEVIPYRPLDRSTVTLAFESTALANLSTLYCRTSRP